MKDPVFKIQMMLVIGLFLWTLLVVIAELTK